MDFNVPEKIKIITGMMDEFVEKEIIPLEPEFLTRTFREMLPVLEDKRKMVKQMELWAPNHPKEYGGMGLNLVEHAFVSESLGRSPLGHYIFGCHAPDAGNIEILHLHGTDEQKEEYLRPLVDGRIRSCFSMTEVELAGSNPVMMDTTAVKDGDDYVINGQKWYSTAADGARFSIVMAVTNPDASPYMQASMIIVPIDTPGFNLVRNIPVMGHVGDDFASHSEILLQSCRVPQKNLLGHEGHGFVIAQERLGPGRIHHCKRASERMISRDGKTLATKQIIQSWIAECAANIQAARLMTLNAAWKIEEMGVKEAREDIALIKFFVANVMQDVTDKALQVHGGLGMTDDVIIPFFYRHERAARIYDGADEVHKMSVARRILKKYEGRDVR
ncbi:MAG: acyl-CoA dehydrogenase family protein [Deltaproteobacteria bacterium]|nr:acyl-CoA dehydrogenase family protein [Deltaproteobacteria bacterium]